METSARVFWRVLKRVLLVEGLIVIVTALIVLTTQTFTPFHYGTTLFIVGGLCAVMGALSTTGDFNKRGDWRYPFDRSISVAGLSGRTQHEVTERTAREGFTAIVSIAGALAVVGSIVIQSFG